MSKTVAEHIGALEAKRAAKDARMEAIMEKSMEEGRTTDEAERQEFDDLQAEVDEIDEDLKRFRLVEKSMLASAKPVDGEVDGRCVGARGLAAYPCHGSAPAAGHRFRPRRQVRLAWRRETWSVRLPWRRQPIRTIHVSPTS